MSNLKPKFMLGLSYHNIPLLFSIYYIIYLEPTAPHFPSVGGITENLENNGFKLPSLVQAPTPAELPLFSKQ